MGVEGSIALSFLCSLEASADTGRLSVIAGLPKGFRLACQAEILISSGHRGESNQGPPELEGLPLKDRGMKKFQGSL